MSPPPAREERDLADLGFSKKLAAILISGCLLLVAATGAISLWTSGQHDALARDSAERMVRGGFASLEEKLVTVTRDYSFWTEAFNAISNHDMAWMYPNIATGATETNTADLIIVVEPGEAITHGWNSESGEEPTPNLLPRPVIETALRLLDPLPVDQVEPVHFYTRVDDALWLLAVARVIPFEGLPAGTGDTSVPRQIFGFSIDDTRVAAIGTEFLIDDVAVVAAPRPGNSNLPLRDAAGELVGYVTWMPPRPGAETFASIALPLALALAAIAAVATIASRHIVLSAQRLERALAADRSKSDFLANVSHDLRTPMNGIIGIGQLLQRTTLDEKQDRMLGILLGPAAAQMTLIDNLLDFGRIEAGVRTLDEAPFEPARTVREALGILAPEAERKGLDLRADLVGGESVTVLGDREAFRRIVTNLAGNAVKFTKAGHVAVSLLMSRTGDRASLVLGVADTGPGIDPEQQIRIFERFARGSSPALPGEGIGLGLAITKSLVKLMGGEIAVNSAPGKGAVFTVTMSCILGEQRDGDRLAR